jgi:hypothetical protein
VKAVDWGSRPPQVLAEQSPDPDGNPARRGDAHLDVAWFLPYRHNNDREQD